MTVSYHISFPDPKSHLAQVEIMLDSTPAGLTEAWMPVWSPGSYLVREYSRNIQHLCAFAEDGQPVVVKKTTKNRWRIGAVNHKALTIRYEIYGLEKSVRTNWIDVDHAFLNGPSTFLIVRGTEAGPFQVTVEAAQGWNQAYCPLTPARKTSSITYTAFDLDTLLDSPILCGSPQAYSFEVQDKTVTLINQGESGLWDGAKAAKDVQTIVETYGAMFGSYPYPRYLFYNLIVESGGGLEHKDCSVLMTSRNSYRQRETYVKWLSLVSHEFFHVWNVKRSRPLELGPFDYESEVYSRNLWVAEGITAYYTDLMPKGAGLFSPEEYLGLLSAKINQLQNTPGRLMQSLEESSFDAWIKLYRADENSVNSTVSYYLKGCLVSWLLDVEIRKHSQGRQSLDDLMRHLYDTYSGERGFTREQVQQGAETAAGASLEDFFSKYIRGTEELDYSPALEYLGLAFAEDSNQKKPWLGITHQTRENRIRVTAVRNDGPGRAAGLMAEDEVLAINEFQVTPATHDTVAAQFKPGDSVDILVSRAGTLRTLPVTFGETPRIFKLIINPEADGTTLAQRKTWWER